MSLDFHLIEVKERSAFDGNITHNLVGMASAVGAYKLLWRPEELGITRADQLILPLKTALSALEFEPERFRCYEPINGWGKYENLLVFIRKIIDVCVKHPEATIRVSR
jgi:hypothetical protein